MADKIDTIPEKVRWELATQGLTGAFAAASTAIKNAVGQEQFEEFNGALWFEAGKGAKEFADKFGMKCETAEEIEAIIHLMAKASMGPEFEFEVAEASEGRCVGRATHCPWHERWKEQHQNFNSCGVGHQRWGDGAVESLNPNFSFRLTKNMNCGDAHCEWVVERKK